MKEALRLAAVVARVVAWHNRHPLARRITAAQVHAVGYVALPFAGPGVPPAPSAAAVAAEAIAQASQASQASQDAPPSPAGPAGEAAPPPEASSLRERAQARAQQAAAAAETATPAAAAVAAAADGGAAGPRNGATVALQPDFSEDFIDPLPPKAVARFALQAGELRAHAPTDGPVRPVRADGRFPGRATARVYLLTAVIETGTRKSRVLLGGGAQASVLGRRVFDTARVLALALVLALGGLAAAALVWQTAAPSAPSAPSAPAAPAAPASAPASAASAASAAAPAATEASGPAAPALAAPAAASAPRIVEPAPERGKPVSVVPMLSEEAKAQARAERQALRPQAAPAAPQPAEAPPKAGAPAAAPPAAAPVTQAVAQPPAPTPTAPRAALPPGAPAFALSTRTLRTRTEADQVRVAMQSLLRTLGHEAVKVEVLPQGDDWRVVGWPFPQRADAEKARALLVSRGMRVEVVDF